ncbi:hypothetical protein ERX27_09800 [Macrococcus brunensis]|uniref:Uncharacterized protein n=1 Tax=Macrococcus brunensis TaxID=198483 RepID=A0A4R6BB22_9STAP|nr:hypothetical protein [Macrococcus brunensis]TDL94161.1 hypothetical protein ERX27_09800 [Macrococcus brunensis]
MKKLATVVFASALFVTPFADHQADAAAAPSYKAPDLLNTTVAKQLKNDTFVYKRVDGKAVKIGDTFKTAKYQWGRPSYLSTYSLLGNSSFEAGYGPQPIVVLKGATAKYVENFNNAKVNSYQFYYENKYSPTAIQKVYGKPTSSSRLNSHEIEHYYKDLFKVTYEKNNEGKWRVRTVIYAKNI